MVFVMTVFPLGGVKTDRSYVPQLILPNPIPNARYDDQRRQIPPLARSGTGELDRQTQRRSKMEKREVVRVD